MNCPRQPSPRATRRASRPQKSVQHQREVLTLDEVKHWLTPVEFEAKWKQIATATTVRRDISHRHENGLEALGAIRKCGAKFRVDERIYVPWRMGDREQDTPTDMGTRRAALSLHDEN